MEEISIKVYVMMDEKNNITTVSSDIFIQDLINWIEIDSGLGDEFAHAQNYYFDKPIITHDGIYRYKLVDGQPKEKTKKEIEKEIAALPPPPVPELEILKNKVSELSEENQVLNTQLTETQVALCDVFEQNINLNLQLTETQTALCDVYELVLGGVI